MSVFSLRSFASFCGLSEKIDFIEFTVSRGSGKVAQREMMVDIDSRTQRRWTDVIVLTCFYRIGLLMQIDARGLFYKGEPNEIGDTQLKDHVVKKYIYCFLQLLQGP